MVHCKSARTDYGCCDNVILTQLNQANRASEFTDWQATSVRFPFGVAWSVRQTIISVINSGIGDHPTIVY
jgi:hypothetical protein